MAAEGSLVQPCVLEHGLIQTHPSTQRGICFLHPCCFTPFTPVSSLDCLEHSRSLRATPTDQTGNLNNGGNCHDETNAVHHENVSTKDDQILGRLKEGTETARPTVQGGWPDYERWRDRFENLWKSLDNRVTTIHQDIKEIQRSEMNTSHMMVAIDERVNSLVERTASTLVSHSQHLELSKVKLSEDLKDVKENLQALNKLSEALRQHMAVTGHQYETIRNTLDAMQVEFTSRPTQADGCMVPLQESLSQQKKEMMEMRSGMEKLATCLEEGRNDRPTNGMGSEAMKERIMELTSQRDAEKIFHRITRQSLRALERDHERLRQEYVRATCRRYSYGDSDRRMWLYMNNHDPNYHTRNGPNPNHQHTDHDPNHHNHSNNRCPSYHHHHNNNHTSILQTLRRCAASAGEAEEEEEGSRRGYRQHSLSARKCLRQCSYKSTPEDKRAAVSTSTSTETRNIDQERSPPDKNSRRKGGRNSFKSHSDKESNSAQLVDAAELAASGSDFFHKSTSLGDSDPNKRL